MKLAITFITIIVLSGLSYLGITDYQNYSFDSSTSFSFARANIDINNGQLLTFLTISITFIVFAVITLKQKFNKKLNNIMLLLSSSILILTITVYTTKANWVNESAMKPEDVRMSLQLLFLIFLVFQFILVNFLIVGAVKTGELIGKTQKSNIS